MVVELLSHGLYPSKEELLKRLPDASRGLAAWVGQIYQCGNS
jgi:hypothetical protein